MAANKFLSNTFSLEGKSILITGASSGFGEHFARVYAEAGAKVLALAARRTDRLEKLAEELRGKYQGITVVPVTCDVSSIESIKACFDKIEKEANTTFNVIVNNAGLGDPTPALKVDEDYWNRVINVNVRGCYFVATEAARRLKAKNVKGSIINIGSIYGLRVGIGHSVYSTSKAALVQMTKALALEFVRYNVRVNAILPGYYITELTEEFYGSPAGKKFIDEHFPSKRLGTLDELNGALILLSSEASSNMMGAAVTVDGGHAVSSL